MWEMAKSSIVLFFRGKLFAHPGQMIRQLLIGIVITAIVLVGLVKLGTPLLTAAIIAGLVGGAFQPLLFKNLKYV